MEVKDYQRFVAGYVSGISLARVPLLEASPCTVGTKSQILNPANGHTPLVPACMFSNTMVAVVWAIGKGAADVSK